jgi:hypothetical protein
LQATTTGVGKDIIRSAKLAPAATISGQRSCSQRTSKLAAKVCLAPVSTTIARSCSARSNRATPSASISGDRAFTLPSSIVIVAIPSAEL